MAQLRPLMEGWSPLEISDMDGLHARFSDGWVLMRPSGTEPKLKLVIEGETEARANELMAMAMEAIGRVLG